MGSRQNDEETGYYKTWISVKPSINVNKKPKLDAARKERGIYLRPDDDLAPKDEGIVGHCEKIKTTSGELQRCLAKSQAGGDPVQVMGLN